MRSTYSNLPIPASATAGDPVHCDEIVDKTIQVFGTFVASIRIQGSLDGTNWSDFGTPITTPSIVAIDATMKMIRANVSSYTSGTPGGLFSGLMARTE